MPRVEAELDVSRLSELQHLLGTEVPAIVRTLVTELTAAVATIDDGLQTGDLSEVAAAAHAGRNSALMIDAQPLLRLLKQIETCARNDEPEGATAARARLRRAWPRLRRQLERAAEVGN
ncbi:MAG TPA: Hpt domain-containing protein [Solirubrobacteraceae bacterium]|jgi:HPt (histidine-containing phosphotransfer) domain-containing protein|nr:Hpt domain-containing protein [Solirubrobacteraceae bacterium]